MTIRVAASLWSVTSELYLDTLARLRAAGVTHIHWDLADGRFAPTGGFSAAEAARLTAASGLAAEAHLMVETPLTEVDRWTEFCDLVVVHVEAPDAHAAVRRIEQRGARPGLALARATSITAAGIDLPVLAMSIDPGHAGSPFDPATIDRLAALRANSDDQRLVGVDGGVDPALARQAVAAGSNWIVSGTSLTAAEDPAAWLATVRHG